MGWRHVGEDQIGMRQDVLSQGHIYPGAVHATGRSTFREIAALDRLFILHARVETVGFGHEGDCIILRSVLNSLLIKQAIHLDKK